MSVVSVRRTQQVEVDDLFNGIGMAPRTSPAGVRKVLRFSRYH
jgi:hypothetical protein